MIRTLNQRVSIRSKIFDMEFYKRLLIKNIQIGVNIKEEREYLLDMFSLL